MQMTFTISFLLIHQLLFGVHTTYETLSIVITDKKIYETLAFCLKKANSIVGKIKHAVENVNIASRLER